VTKFWSEKEAINSLTDIRINNFVDEETFLDNVNSFFEKLSKLKIVQELKNWDNEKKLLNWLFTISSLYDTNFSRFNTLESFLDFLYINVAGLEEFFWDDYIEVLKETSWIPVDDLEWKENLKLPKERFIWKIGEIEFWWEKIDLLLRFFPSFWPTWLCFSISLNLENSLWEKNNNNYVYIFALSLEREGEEIIPIIHTIQNSFHNIWFNEEWKLFQVSEPLKEEDKNLWIKLLERENEDTNQTQKQKNKMKISLTKSISEYFSWLKPEDEILALIMNGLFEKWFKKIKIIDWKENLRLTRHNTNRDEKSLEKTYDAMYGSTAKALWATQNENSWYYLNSVNIIKYLGKYPEISKMVEGLVSPLVELCKKLELLKQSNSNKDKLTWTVSEINAIVESCKNKVELIIWRSKNVENFTEVYNSSFWEQNHIKLFSELTWKEPEDYKKMLAEWVGALYNIWGSPQLPSEIKNQLYNSVMDIDIKNFSQELQEPTKKIIEKINLLLRISF
jgi:hypothetical protein